MLNANSFGRATPNQKSINVEINLLAEWLDERRRLRESRLRSLVILALGFAAMLLLGPSIWKLGSESAERAARAEGRMNQLQGQLAAAQAETEKLQPQVDNQTVLAQSQANIRRFVGEMLVFMNDMPSSVALRLVDVTILGGEVTIRAQADAETFTGSEELVRIAQQTPRTKSAIVSQARRSDALGPDSVSFELVKKVTLE